MLSNFLTEDLFKKGLAVRILSQSLGGGAGGGFPGLTEAVAEPGATALPSQSSVFPQSYLQAFAYQNTTYLNLWEHLQMVSTNQPS